MSWPRLGILAARAAGLAYPLLIVAACQHRIDAHDPWAPAWLLLALALPLALLCAWSARALAPRLGLPAARARVALFGVLLAAGVAVVLGLAPRLLPHATDFYLLQDLSFFAVLAWAFGASLRPGRDPLCTFFARFAHERVSPRLLGYTRRLTAAWCAFFVAIMAASTLLYFEAAPEHWALFTNLAVPILMLAFFLLEYGLRLLVLPREDRADLAGTLRAIRRGGMPRAWRVPPSPAA